MQRLPSRSTENKRSEEYLPGIGEDLEWWNKLLPVYNGVHFFDICTGSRETQSLYTDACLYGLGEFFT